MTQALAPKPPVLVQFVCPACKAEQGVSLIALSRAGSMNCEACKRRLTTSDVSRAIHTPRK